VPLITWMGRSVIAGLLVSAIARSSSMPPYGALRGEEQPSGRGRRRQRAGDVGDNAGVAGRADLGAAKVVKDAAAVPVGDRDVVAQVRSSTSSQRFSWMTRKPTPRGSGLGTAWRYRNPPS
jgi:hypothetical protein